jgi:hypothetical protein
MQEVRVRALTGSVLCFHARAVRPELLVEVATREAAVRFSGRAPAPPAIDGSSTIARELARLFHDLDAAIVRRTESRADLGVLVAFSFFGAGALDVLVTGRLPAPPWFNLAWWGFRSFMTLETGALREAGNGDDAEPS